MFMDIYTVNAFSKDGCGGNPAGVIINGSSLQSYSDRIRLASQLGYSETVFCDGSHIADMRLSYFTPEEEVPLCGHATIAFFVLLRELGKVNKKKYRVETKAGVIDVNILEDGLVMMSQCLPIFSSPVSTSEIKECFSDFVQDYRFSPMVVSTGLRDIMLPVPSADILFNMKPDFEKISYISKKYECIGIHAFALTEATNNVKTDNDTIAVCRNFAPLYGINEEPATGTSNCALASYLFTNGIKRDKYIFLQGHNLDCISEIVANICSDGDKITSVAVGGRGYINHKCL